MTFSRSLSNPDLASISFEEAIAYTEQLLLDNGKLADGDLHVAIRDLITSSNGARGFLVSYLTKDGEISDLHRQAAIAAIKSVPMPASELLVKNLVMSTAMAIAHRRHGKTEPALGSDRVARRSTELIQLTNLEQIKRIAILMQQSIQSGEGEYAEFLTKWGYDAEQKVAMDIALAKAIAS